MDEEILQDFLVEATELLDQLNEQLVDLENSPDDSNLLNTIFRGFHTVKGGAGFLGVSSLVQVCHRAENVFDKIRNQEVAYDADVADVILRAFDQISRIIGELSDGVREFDDIDPVLLDELDAIVKGEVQEAAQTSSAITVIPEVSLSLPDGVDPDGEISDDEFEALLNQRDQLLGEPSQPANEPKLQLPEGVDPDGEISDDEFEALLSQRDLLLGAEHKPQDLPQASPAVKPKPKAPIKKSAEPSVPAASKAAGESTVRVDTRHLDAIMNLVGELVLVRNRLLTLRSAEASLEDISNAVGNLDHVTTDLQASVMKTRMQPVKKVFGRFPRVVRDLARKLGKDIDLELVGEETDLDKGLVEALADPLVHLVRNSVDHGIEMPDVREDAGKSKTGRIVLAAEQEGDHILLSITDDGKGMDPDMLRRKAVEKGMMDEASANQLDDKQAFMLIMSAGFSLAKQVSDLSGRGVGMDVVKNMITKLNGSIDIDSAVGEGTRIKIRVPLTLAILPTLMVSFGHDSYAIPLTSVQEIFDYDANKTNTIDGQTMVRLRKKSLPLFFLAEWLRPGHFDDQRKGDKIVIVSIGNQRVGLVVEQVNGQEEVVIKPLGVMLQNIKGYAGATITGNGNIALILDLPGLIERFK
ncbi:chemotaxis protein CheA [Thiomicrospira sp. R3]|uniref:chemotaxis protein CheA n=1 Tax=Thiomicrospira sp. R3 TaxID=3035472 RepID=UPI00259B7FE5|nr:chemotaxis protein CheA [Thiomicrospira sp. R3]WFE68983.1 chemotaxis protein CheA [Thiomicrospira sp. R3]